jgi:hypothetical protein
MSGVLLAFSLTCRQGQVGHWELAINDARSSDDFK